MATGRAQAISARPAGRPRASAAIARPALTSMKTAEATPQMMSANMMPPPESGPCDPDASIASPNGISSATNSR